MRSLDMRLLGLMLATAGCGVHAVQFSNAADMRAKMEAEVATVAGSLQAGYEDIVNTGSDGISNGCAYKNMCDKTGWDKATKDDQYNNPATSTCVRRDRSEDFKSVMTTAVGGRNLVGSATLEKCQWYQVVEKSNSSEKCAGPAALTTNRCQVNNISQDVSLDASGCTSAADKGKCMSDRTQYGVTWPEGFVGSSTRLANAEICATNRLVDRGSTNFESIRSKYPQTGWQFLGLQATGLYRNWPAIHQCRTERMCSGCSDPRFRGWYASTASGAKDLVLVMDTSGSMTAAGRMGHAKTAGMWVLNTLTDVDRASVVDFNSQATKASTYLLKVDKLGKQQLSAFISAMEPYGRTDMYSAFEAAFQILKASPAQGASTRCSKIILFLTDGKNSGKDPLAMITKENAGPYGPTHTLNSEHARIFTYAFGDTVDPLMKTIACQNGGVYKHIPDSEAKHLKEAMAGYYTYLAAGISKPKSKADKSEVHWSEPFEDGQGTGQLTAACARVYDFTKDPWELFGVLCLGVSMNYTKSFSDWSSVSASMTQARSKCPDLSLTWKQLESLRGKSSCVPQPVKLAAAADTSSSYVGVIVAAAGAGGVLVLLVLCNACSNGSGVQKPKKTAPPMPLYTPPAPRAPSRSMNHASAPPMAMTTVTATAMLSSWSDAPSKVASRPRPITPPLPVATVTAMAYSA